MTIPPIADFFSSCFFCDTCIRFQRKLLETDPDDTFSARVDAGRRLSTERLENQCSASIGSTCCEQRYWKNWRVPCGSIWRIQGACSTPAVRSPPRSESPTATCRPLQPGNYRHNSIQWPQDRFRRHPRKCSVRKLRGTRAAMQRQQVQ